MHAGLNMGNAIESYPIDLSRALYAKALDEIGRVYCEIWRAGQNGSCISDCEANPSGIAIHNSTHI